jgi:hypothetical protein
MNEQLPIWVISMDSARLWRGPLELSYLLVKEHKPSHSADHGLLHPDHNAIKGRH